MEPMKWDKPLGSVALPLDDIIPEFFATPTETPTTEKDDKTPDLKAEGTSNGASDNSTTKAVEATSIEDDLTKRTLDAVAKKLTASVVEGPKLPMELKDCWIEVTSTDLKAMYALVDQATGETPIDTVFYGTEQDEQVSHFGLSIKDKIIDALQNQLLDPAGQRAFDDLDWSKVVQSNDKDNFLLRLRWRPLKADATIKKVRSFKVDFTEAELEEVEEEPLGAVCPTCMRQTESKNTGESVALCHENITVHPILKPLAESQKGRCSRLEAAMARRNALDQVGMVTGVLAVFVERSKLHFGKNSATPTMAVHVSRAAEKIGFPAGDLKRPDLPTPALSLRCRERNQNGTLEWGQTFYLPVSVGSDELEHGGLVVQLDLGGIRSDSGLFGIGVGSWKRGKSGHGILALDAFDSYKDDVEVVAITQYELKKVVNAGKEGISEKLILSQPREESNKFWEGGRKITNSGTVKVKFAWFAA